MTCNPRIAKIFPSLAGISIGKMPSGGPKTLRWSLFAGPYLSSPSSVSHKSRILRKRVAQAFQRYQEHQKPTSGARSTVRANTDKKWGKCAGNLMRFSSRTTTFARGFLPAHCDLIREPRCVTKTETPAERHNSRFAVGIPHLAEIFAGKTRKNSSDTPTSGSHNSPVWTPIRANLISLESRLHDLSEYMLHDPFWAPEGLKNLPQKFGQKMVHTQKSRRIRWKGCVADKNAMWWGARQAWPHHALRGMRPR